MVKQIPHKEKLDSEWRLVEITDAGGREDELIEAYNLMQEISETDPDLQSWEYFVWPESIEDCANLMSELRGPYTVFKADEVKEFKIKRGLETTKKVPKGRRNQSQKQKCREIAEKKWAGEPFWTITRMVEYLIKSRDVNQKEISRKDGRLFRPKTYEDWIRPKRPGYKGKS